MRLLIGILLLGSSQAANAQAGGVNIGMSEAAAREALAKHGVVERFDRGDYIVLHAGDYGVSFCKGRAHSITYNMGRDFMTFARRAARAQELYGKPADTRSHAQEGSTAVGSIQVNWKRPDNTRYSLLFSSYGGRTSVAETTAPWEYCV